MYSKLKHCTAGRSLRAASLLAPTFLMAFVATGCSVSPLAKHTATFATATNLLVDNSTNAYRAAETLHDNAQGYQAVAHFDSDPPYNPYKTTPLMSEKGIQVRIDLLAAIKTYAQSLADLAGGAKSDQLDQAAASVGTNLKAMSGTLATDVADSAGSASNKLVLSDGEANGISTAAEALGSFLASKKVKSEVPKQIKAMQPNIEALCKLLQDDIGVLRKQSSLDYSTMVEDQDGFIRHNTTLTPLERREQILVLPQLVQSQRATDTLLAQLQDSLLKFNLTYQALAAEAQGNNPESLAARISDLEATGENLAKYYQSLPSK
jgi:hypothetical protein